MHERTHAYTHARTHARYLNLMLRCRRNSASLIRLAAMREMLYPGSQITLTSDSACTTRRRSLCTKEDPREHSEVDGHGSHAQRG
jgi:hypothetical protein